jgi:hypothetical protein
VNDKNGNKIDYFNVELFADTVSIMGGSFINGQFTIKIPEHDEFKLKISSMGYEDKYINIFANQLNDTVKCSMTGRQYVMDEVMVTAVQPKLTAKNNTYTLSVDKTYLSNESSIKNVITKLPFVLLSSDNKISVAGKNNVVVYIDNRKVVYAQELDILSPVNIKEICLLQNPGSRYDASADAVILITTKKNNQEETSFSIKTMENFSRAFSFDINPSVMSLFKCRIKFK